MKKIKILVTLILLTLFSCQTDEEPSELPTTQDVVMFKINNQNWEGIAQYREENVNYTTDVYITGYTDLYGSAENPEFTLQINKSLIQEGQTIGVMGQNAVAYASFLYQNNMYHSYNGPAIEIGYITITKTNERLIGNFEIKVYPTNGLSEKEIKNGYFNVKIN